MVAGIVAFTTGSRGFADFNYGSPGDKALHETSFPGHLISRRAEHGKSND